uniref:Methyltransferase type 11 domain-containing protein n=1 Tax=Hanusia phi TaxID=3032 RepID=A0A7S0EH38_9CRYP|mmetsp:Transcript_23279/g.52277  ORF Transcript_23279/g.52277 Transcript_23279/m.52277 type:complete len:739 (+) Transcript_23279:71-2287(+)
MLRRTCLVVYLVSIVSSDLLPVNKDLPLHEKPVTIWPLTDAQVMHFHSSELAQALPKMLNKALPVIDLGCGKAFYISKLSELGYQVHGIEGTPGIEEIAYHRPILTADLSEPLSLDLPHGNVMSLEVAEHLAPDDEDVYLENIIKFCRSRLIVSWALPSACAPGRGHGHLNCRDNSYVIRKLFVHGFRFHASDTRWLRQVVKDSQAFWFKDTLMVFDRFAFLQDFGLLKMSLSEDGQFTFSKLSEGRELFPLNDSAAHFAWSERDLICRQAPVLFNGDIAESSVDEDETVDLTIQLDMTNCSSAEEGDQFLSACLLVFVNDVFRQSVCPSQVQVATVQLFALSAGMYNITLCPSLPNGLTSPQHAVTFVKTVRNKEEKMRSQEFEQTAKEDLTLDYDSLLQRLRVVEAEAEELRAYIDDISSSKDGDQQLDVSPRGKFERMLGLREEDVKEIISNLPAGLTQVLDQSPLVRRANTRNLLQEVYVRLHRALFREELLPIGENSTWGNERERRVEEVKVGGPLNALVLPRYAIMRFMRNIAHLIPGGRCLEWGTDYSRTVLADLCQDTWDLRHPSDLICGGKFAISSDLRVICSSLDRLPPLLPPQFNVSLIISTQVFEHVEDDQAAIRSLVEVMAPGAHLLWTTPFLEKYHRAPADFRRYTNDTARYLIERQGGLCIRRLVLAGNPLLTSGYLMGMSSADFTEEELEGLLVGEEEGATMFFGVYVLAQKPPCSKEGDRG